MASEIVGQPDKLDEELLQITRDGIVDEMDVLLDDAAASGMQWAVDKFQRYADLRERLAEIDKALA